MRECHWCCRILKLTENAELTNTNSTTSSLWFQVDCKNRKSSKGHAELHSASLCTSAVLFSFHSPSSFISGKGNMLPISFLSFLTGAIHWMNSGCTRVHVRKREKNLLHLTGNNYSWLRSICCSIFFLHHYFSNSPGVISLWVRGGG